MTQPGMTADYIKIIQTPMRCLFGLEVPSREEFWRYLNHNLSSFFSIFKYHFGKRVLKSTQVFHVYLPYGWKILLYIFRHSCYRLSFYSPVWIVFHHRSKSKSYRDLLEYILNLSSHFWVPNISCLVIFRKETIRAEL